MAVSHLVDEPDTTTDIETRDVKALTECMTVLDDIGRARGADEMFVVTTESGSEYLVDMQLGACECADDRYRDAKCKHRRRVGYATGRRDIPEWANEDVIDDHLGEHITEGDDV